MRAKSLALIFAGFVICAVSSAQGNSVIDNCCYVNRQCATNQDWVDGYHAFQRNECPVSQPVAQAGQPVDNCCYVNRQCNTNQDWVDGWHAFQRNECPAGQPAAPASAPVSAPADQPIDNCCFVNRQCHSNQEWIAGYQAFQNGQCAAPGQPQRATPSGSFPRIEGSDIFVRHIIASLNWLKRLSPEWYNYVVSGMDSIVEVPTPVGGYWTGEARRCTATAHTRERKVSVETCWMAWTIWGTAPPEFDQMTMVGVLAHEACHIYLYEAGVNFPTWQREEQECNKYYRGAEFLLYFDLEPRLGPDFGTTWDRRENLSLIRAYCADKSAGNAFRPELFCATLRRL